MSFLSPTCVVLTNCCVSFSLLHCICKQNFSTLDVYVEEHVKNGSPGSKRVIFEEPEFHYITSDVTPDPYFDTFVDDQLALLGADYFDELALCITELDGRFVSVRTRETGLGNLVCDASTFYTSLSLSLSLSF